MLVNSLKHPISNGWSLFWLLSSLVNIAVVSAITKTELSTPEDISYLIGYSVRWAIPFIYFVVAASSVRVLFPGVVSNWWIRNRKYIGLVFAVAMAWQAIFIFILSTLHRDYYLDEVFYFRDELEGSIGYIFLVAMIATSFQLIRKRLNKLQWKLIHKSGLYFLWAYAFSVYWWNVFYYPYNESYIAPQLHDYLFYWTGFLVFSLRILAWGKTRKANLFNSTAPYKKTIFEKLCGLSSIFLAIAASGTGNFWYEPVSRMLLTPEWSNALSLWLPFWPLEPFLPLLLLGLGIQVLTKPNHRPITPMQPSRYAPVSSENDKS